MAVDIKNLIGAINPKIFCQNASEVETLVKEAGYLKASEKVKLKDSQAMDFDEDIYFKSPFSLPGQKNPIEKHALVYDAAGESLEPVYFWLLDKITKEYKGMDKGQIHKLIDNFVSSPGSGYFSEMGQKATKMQEEAIKMLGTANALVKSVLNLVYDLKEFQMTLIPYKNIKSNKPEVKKSAILSLKQKWMDTVDFNKRGTSSIKALAQQFQYATLIDAFMAADSLEEAQKLDLNDRVKRIILQRIGEFYEWIKLSEQELTKRFEIEKLYLKSQVDSIRLYASWVKPYLKAAKALEQRGTPTAALVTAFNTVLFELTILGEAEYRLEDDINKGDLPQMMLTAKRKKYYSVILVELKFRSIPDRTQQGGYSFRGRLEATFTSFALSGDEIKLLIKEVEKDDLGDLIGAIEGVSEESLEKIQVDLDEFLSDKNNDDDEKNKEEDTNPFSALVSLFKSESSKNKNEEGKKNKEKIKLEPDNDIEKVARSQALINARRECRKIYNLYKKTHNMPAF